MGIQVSFNTDDLNAEDVAVLGALARSLADPEWAEVAEKPKRGVGRPRMTDEEKAEAAAKRAAEKAEKEKAEKDAAEKLAAEKASAPVEEQEEAAEEPKEAAPATKKAPAKPEATEPAPEPEEPKGEPEEEPAGDEKAEAVRLATALVHDGRGAEVRNALKEVGAKKVSDLSGKSLTGFIAIAKDL